MDACHGASSGKGGCCNHVWSIGPTLLLSCLTWCVACAVPLYSQEIGPGTTDRPLLLDGYEELWRIAGVTATGWDAFGSVGTVAFGPGGEVVVHDRLGMRVVVVSAEGELVREVAGRGDGPGEFRSVNAVLVGQDGGFTIYDGVRQAFLLFSGDGGFLTSVSVGAEKSPAWVLPHLTPSNSFREAFRAVPAGSGRAREIQRLSFEDGSLNTESYYEAWRSADQELPDGAGVVVTNASTGEVEPAEAYFPPLRMDRLPDGGLLVADSSAYAIKVVDPAGGVARVVCRPIRPTGVDGRMRRAAQELLRESADVYTGLPTVYKGVMNAIDNMRHFPEVPVITGLRSGWKGEIWVRRRGDDAMQADGPIDVFSPQGAYVGTFDQGVFPLPDALGPEGLAAFVERDPLDVPTVVVARLPMAVRAAGETVTHPTLPTGSENPCASELTAREP